MNDVLKAVAPTLATLLGGPVAGLAVEAIGAAFGWSDATKEKVEQTIKSGQMSGEDIAKLKIAENEVKIRMRELDIRIEELEVQDRHSARERESKTGGITTPVLAWAIVGAFIAMACGLIFGKAVVDSALAGTVIGYLSAKAEQVLSYYFGSSRGSDDKNALIAKLQDRS